MPTHRNSTFLVVCEGSDETHLANKLVALLGQPEVSVDIMNAEGNSGIKSVVSSGIKIPGPPINKLFLLRDAERSFSKTGTSCENILEHVGFPIPNKSLEIASYKSKHACYAILPHDKLNGAIEDTCLSATKYPEILSCVTQMLDCAKAHYPAGFASTPTTDRKSLAGAYLAACPTDKFIHRVGLGFSRNLFDLNSVHFEPISEALRRMFAIQ